MLFLAIDTEIFESLLVDSIITYQIKVDYLYGCH